MFIRFIILNISVTELTSKFQVLPSHIDALQKHTRYALQRHILLQKLQIDEFINSN